MILIVDDSPETCQPIARLLTRLGYHVQCVSHGRDALEVMGTVQPECVVLDLMMPEVSGLDVLASMRRQHGLANVPVLMYSAGATPEDRTNAARLGANDFVTKGTVEWPDLLCRIEALCHPAVTPANQ
jgi:two-component system sensor histidine kinase ChiS